jgi:DNA polymerase-3 subunit delta'
MALFIHPHTATALQSLAKKLPHALLLSGPQGIGLTTLAMHLIREAGDEAKPQIIESDEKNTISIDAIRELYQQTRTKRAARVIIIKNADHMTDAAQNAFLKLLEEPGQGLSFLLTSHAPTKLLPTIISRVQHIITQPITHAQTEQLLDASEVTDKTRRMQLIFIAKGLPAEITRLTENEDYFITQAQIMRDARELLQASDYDKLLLANTYSVHREKSLQLLGAAMQIIRSTMQQKPQTNMIAQLEKFLHAEARIRENGHVRTQLLQAILGEN